MKVNAFICALAIDRDLDCWDLNDGACSPRTVKSGGKLWLMLVAILTCKSFVMLGVGTNDKQNHQDYWSPRGCSGKTDD